jgi:hypothetical protein
MSGAWPKSMTEGMCAGLWKLVQDHSGKDDSGDFSADLGRHAVVRSTCSHMGPTGSCHEFEDGRAFFGLGGVCSSVCSYFQGLLEVTLGFQGVSGKQKRVQVLPLSML